MPYREKTAWLSLIAMALAIVLYFAIVLAGSHSRTSVPNLRQLSLFAVAAIVQMVILGIGHLYLNHGSSTETHSTGRTECRNHAPFHRPRLLRSDGWHDPGGLRHAIQFQRMGHHQCCLVMIVLAEAVHYGVAVITYRRQA